MECASGSKSSVSILASGDRHSRSADVNCGFIGFLHCIEKRRWRG